MVCPVAFGIVHKLQITFRNVIQIQITIYFYMCHVRANALPVHSALVTKLITGAQVTSDCLQCR